MTAVTLEVHSKKTEHLMQGVVTCFGCEYKTGLVRILIFFQDRLTPRVHSRAFGVVERKSTISKNY